MRTRYGHVIPVLHLASRAQSPTKHYFANPPLKAEDPYVNC